MEQNECICKNQLVLETHANFVLERGPDMNILLNFPIISLKAYSE